jgi:hypothetical protein
VTQPKTLPLPKLYITGFCAVGQHEKTTLQSPKGLQLKACEGKYLVSTGMSAYGRLVTVVCNCNCHQAFAEIRDMLGLLDDMHGFGGSVGDATVKETDNPSVGLPVAVLPAPGLREALAPVTASPTVTPVELGRELLPFQRAAFKPTPTGRAARGELEDKIRQVVIQYHELAADMLTPEMIGKFINKEKPPSSGAIHACLTRWEARGWVTLLKKPFRLGVLTEGGKTHLLK